MFGFLVAKMTFTLMKGTDDLEEYLHYRNLWTIGFAILVVGIAVFNFLQKYFFGIGGENLTLEIRLLFFRNLLKKHIGWFDDKDKATGVLTNMIQEDIT